MHPGHHTEFRPRALRAATAGGAYAARAFGSSRRDLDLDLVAADRPALVTQALATCLSGFEPVADAETVVWEWTVAERLQGLLAIAIATDDAPSLQTRCTQGDCRTEMQIELDLAAFVAESDRDPVVCALDGSELVLRLPRGRRRTSSLPSSAQTTGSRSDSATKAARSSSICISVRQSPCVHRVCNDGASSVAMAMASKPCSRSATVHSQTTVSASATGSKPERQVANACVTRAGRSAATRSRSRSRRDEPNALAA